MKTEIYWIPELCFGRLAVMARPRAGDWLEDEIKSWRVSGINTVVSLLTPSEIRELGLEDEPKVCQNSQIEYISYPICDRQVPASPTATIAIVREICIKLKLGKGVGIHCRMGIGRSALIATCVLVNQGITANHAYEIIGKARGIEVPDTEEQRNWVEFLAKNLKS